MAVWFSEFSLEFLNSFNAHTLNEHFGITFTEMTDSTLSAVMPVTDRNRQSRGMLNGGASAALAETVGGFASQLCVDPERFYCVGQEIIASHVRPVRDGYVTATASPVHLGRKTHLWDIRITNPAGKLVCSARLTSAVLPVESQR